ncbi:GumC family protein [Merismopedia glauca]|uniref:Capsular biosynthesis protein n=1 Tax=Merismopedia glauca CCAP 1448/3 TaxID=1296344 RepID=A0A2T1C461_9CYAN|nr:tyrosine-protein kinase domain-containing protein [Merismopedia glauca]PSB03072.1 capsular biosynthesis protein [Merismopedia glauca CCAP 1448/3]
MESAKDWQLEQQDDLKSSSPKGLSIRPWLRLLQRHALLIAGITGLSTLGAWFWATRDPLVYQGGFQILVEPLTKEDRATDPTTIAGGARDSSQSVGLDYATQLRILQGYDLLKEIVEKVKTRYPTFGFGRLRYGLVVERVSGKTKLDQTKIIQVSYQDTNPEVADFVIQTTSEKFLEYSLNQRKTRIGEAVKFIDEQIPDLRKRVDTIQAELQKLQQKYQLTDPRTRGEELFTQARAATSQQQDVQRELRELRTTYASLQKKLQLTPQEAIAATNLTQDTTYQTLFTQIKQIESQIAVESTRFLPTSPQIQDLESKRNQLVSLLNQQKQKVVGSQTQSDGVQQPESNLRQGLTARLLDTADQIQILEVRNQVLAQTRANLELQAQEFPAIARQYSDLQVELERATQILNQLLSQRETLRVQAAQNQFPWELVSPPLIPRDGEGNAIPNDIDPKKKLFVGFGGGLLLGLAAALAIERYRNKFYTAEDIKDLTKLPILGEIPFRPDLRNLATSNVLKEPVDSSNYNSYVNKEFVQSFDLLHAKLKFLYPERPLRSLLVCSAEARDGKSTVALYLAQAAAAAGQRVLLVDANLQLPYLHELLNLPNDRGLTDILSNRLAPKDPIQRSPLPAGQSPQVDNLFVLTSGKVSPTSSRLLESTYMQSCVKELQSTFDLVIYDSSDISSHPDANLLSAHVDGAILVVSLMKSHRSVVVDVVDQINSYKFPLWGIVVNKMASSRTPIRDNDPNLPEETSLEIASEEPLVEDRIGEKPEFKS